MHIYFAKYGIVICRDMPWCYKPSEDPSICYKYCPSPRTKRYSWFWVAIMVAAVSLAIETLC